MPKVSQEHLDARKQQILDAAMECFARKGFHKTTMSDIIEESDLSPGAIYRYFSGKNHIIDEIARERHTRENALLLNALDTGNKTLGLHELARAFFASFAAEEHRKTRRVGVEVWAEALHNPEVLETVRRGVDEPRKRLARIVTECQERGELPPQVDPEGLARVMIAVFQGFVLQQAWNPRVDRDRYLATIDYLLDALASYRGG